MLKDKLCFGNWKLNKTPKEASAYLNEFYKMTTQKTQDHFCIFPTSVLAGVFSSEKINWGGQNCYIENQGAFTGETSASTLKNMNASYCLIGHSERRSVFGEKDEFLNKKVKNTLKEGLIPVFCIGETLKDRELGKTFEILKKQIDLGLKDIDLKKIVLAYEPVWAIGTGKAATFNIVKEVHDYLRNILSLKDIPLLYGGSVKSSNAKELYSIDNVNGFLIGGASLHVKSFIEIFNKM